MTRIAACLIVAACFIAPTPIAAQERKGVDKVYVERDKQGKIEGVYAGPQPGAGGKGLRTDPKWLYADDPEVIAYHRDIERSMGKRSP
jgi:hypothetical protein